MNSKKKRLRDSRLYLILDKQSCAKKKCERILSQAIKGKIDIVQYRDKISPSKTMVREARTLLKISRRHKIPFIINDRLDVALLIDADGIHLGKEDMPVSWARKILGKDKLIGLSCSDLNDIKDAPTEYVDYLGLGPVFATKTKPWKKPIGPQLFQKALKNSSIPVFAIGGIDEKNIDRLSGAGPVRIAVCRVLCRSKNTINAAKNLKKKLSHV